MVLYSPLLELRNVMCRYKVWMIAKLGKLVLANNSIQVNEIQNKV